MRRYPLAAAAQGTQGSPDVEAHTPTPAPQAQTTPFASITPGQALTSLLVRHTCPLPPATRQGSAGTGPHDTTRWGGGGGSQNTLRSPAPERRCTSSPHSISLPCPRVPQSAQSHAITTAAHAPPLPPPPPHTHGAGTALVLGPARTAFQSPTPPTPLTPRASLNPRFSVTRGSDEPPPPPYHRDTVPDSPASSATVPTNTCRKENSGCAFLRSVTQGVHTATHTNVCHNSTKASAHFRGFSMGRTDTTPP